jgi:hypothetical protein
LFKSGLLLKHRIVYIALRSIEQALGLVVADVDLKYILLRVLETCLEGL